MILGRDHRQGATGRDRLQDGVRVIGFIGDHRCGREAAERGRACGADHAPCCPAVRLKASGLPRLSPAACSLLEKPPRERPSA